MSVLYLFPSFIAKKKCNFDVDSLCNHVYEMKDANPESLGYSSKNGWHSLFIEQNNKIVPLLNGLMHDVGVLVKELGINYNRIDMNSMWAMINSKGSYNISHVHGMCNLSGVLYLKVPNNSGDIVFENVLDQSVGLFNQIKNQEYAGTYSSYNIKPESNLLLLFHPNQRHFVDINESDEDRISLSFNMVVS